MLAIFSAIKEVAPCTREARRNVCLIGTVNAGYLKNQSEEMSVLYNCFCCIGYRFETTCKCELIKTSRTPH